MKRRSGSSVVHAAGWLFADLLLVITVIALGGQWTAPTTADRADGEPSASPAPAVSASPTPSPRVSAAQPGLDPDSEEFDVRGDAPGLLAREAAAVRDIRDEVAKGISAYPGKRAALVIIWGTAGSCRTCPVTDNASRDYARAIGALLPSVSATFFPAYHEEIIRGYRNTSGDRERGQATIELFFLRQ
ncbi:hypothetical protein [Streptomyces albipurpureus]|uniref:Uncharacterized protein n=1 Tax=Streptomyces albipurpureus TaxID=2897419 RepID=A0ABT0UZG5_9ACTN|nr:hypothetical protein [Streptomyces sp. CWNU-1]MCM2393870.1 hypothetical protein [Streptomyces sp. CWNU-1]